MTTPGPWGIEPTTLEICRLLISTEEVNCDAVRPESDTNYVIAYIPTDYNTDEQHENAILIASTPRLSKALKDFVNWQVKDGLERLGFLQAQALDALAERKAA